MRNTVHRIETFLSGLREPLSDLRRGIVKEAFGGFFIPEENGDDGDNNKVFYVRHNIIMRHK